jgi:Zn-dependent protease
VGRGFRIARIAGIEIRGDISLLILAALLTFDLTPFFDDRFRFPTVTGSQPVLFALLTTALFVASILAHELAHAVAFRSRGIPVLGITLYMFGGYTQGGSEAKTPGDEFLVAVVGPLTTLVIGVVCFLLRAVLGTPSNPWRGMFDYLGRLNILIAVFNLLPGFPLDGGRVTLAALWKVTKSRTRGTILAARGGQIVAAAVILLAIVPLVLGRGDSGLALWPILIGAMLFQASTAAVRQTRGRAVLDRATARDVMSPAPPTVPAEMGVGEAVERYLTGHEGEAFPVVDDGRVVGFVSLGMTKDAWPSTQVRSVMTGTELVVFARPDEPMTEVAERMQDRRATVALIQDGSRLVGVIEPEDLERFLGGRARRHPAGAGSTPGSGAPPRPDV